MKSTFLFYFSFFLWFSGIAQTKEQIQGYAQQGDTTIFIFDEKVYNLIPTRVVVTGAFRNWNQNMDDASWALKKNIEGRSVQLARVISCQHAEGLIAIKPLGVNLLSDLL